MAITKENICEELNAYAITPDDDAIRIKELIKQELLHCPELLYALNNKDHVGQLFDADGNLDEEGEWDLYFNDNVRPYTFFPESQSVAKNYVCYKTEFEDVTRYNAIEKYMRITFMVLCDVHDIIDPDTGLARHDLIGSIIRERFNWSNIFGTQVKLVSNKESVTDNNYITRTMIFQGLTPNSIVRTDKNGTRIINNVVRTAYDK